MGKPRQSPAQEDLMRRLRGRMRAEGVGLREVAARIGCSQSNLSRMLNGRIGVSAALEARIEASSSIEDETVESVIAMVRNATVQELKVFLQILQFLQGLQNAGTKG